MIERSEEGIMDITTEPTPDLAPIHPSTLPDASPDNPLEALSWLGETVEEIAEGLRARGSREHPFYQMSVCWPATCNYGGLRLISPVEQLGTITISSAIGRLLTFSRTSRIDLITIAILTLSSRDGN